MKTLLTRFDLDNSGELEMDEFRSCPRLKRLAGLRIWPAALRQRGSGGVIEFTAELTKLAQKRRTAAFLQRGRLRQKTTNTRRPRACGLRKTDPSEFEGGGGLSFSEASKARYGCPACFDELRAKAKTLAFQSSLREDGIDGKLLKRSLERQRSTPSATHLTAAQFEEALAPFGGVFDEENCLPARVWAACNNGNIEDIMSRFRKECPSEERCPGRFEIEALLLDKFVGMGGPLRLAVREQLHVTGSSGNWTVPSAPAFSGLVPGIEEKQVNMLVDDATLMVLNVNGRRVEGY